MPNCIFANAFWGMELDELVADAAARTLINEKITELWDTAESRRDVAQMSGEADAEAALTTEERQQLRELIEQHTEIPIPATAFVRVPQDTDEDDVYNGSADDPTELILVGFGLFAVNELLDAAPTIDPAFRAKARTYSWVSG